jgi:hypothetical protein
MTHAPNDYALVIGVDHYPEWANGAKTLSGPSNDARDFRDWLVSPSGGGLPEAHVRLVVSQPDPPTPVHDLIDKELKKLRALFGSDPSRRRFYFYFGGHGSTPIGNPDATAMCLAEWSYERPRAALDLDSYRRTLLGCMRFQEALFFLDCCRTRIAAPPGLACTFECLDPQFDDRHWAILYGTEHYASSYEGQVDEDIRGYFTAALLDILRKKPIELRELERELDTAVPLRAAPKKQLARVLRYARRDIVLGPPLPPAGDAPNPVAPSAERFEIGVETNLEQGRQIDADAPSPRPGQIVVLREGTLLGAGAGEFSALLSPGRYTVVIQHGEAVESHIVEHAGPTSKTFPLPRRRSAAPLSSTLDKHEWVTEPVKASSHWQRGEGEQAVFVAYRSRDSLLGSRLAGTLSLFADRRSHDLGRNLTLNKVPPGTWTLRYLTGEEDLRLPVPVAADWDTQIFLIEQNGRPLIESASILMSPAGRGFDPGDSLLDAFERALADLVTGAPGPDETALDKLLYAKWRNPLFGLAGAHFLVRRIQHRVRMGDESWRRGPDRHLLELVIDNLRRLLGEKSPDVLALHVLRARLLGETPTGHFGAKPPLFRPGYDALVEATSVAPDLLGHQLDSVSLALLPGSPWTCWNAAKLSVAVPMGPDGFSPGIVAGILPLPRGPDVPDWLLSMVADEAERNHRLGRPIDPAALARRARTPRSLVERALRWSAWGEMNGPAGLPESWGGGDEAGTAANSEETGGRTMESGSS